MKFDFGAAKKLYRSAMHPRILFGPDDVPALRRRAKSGDGKKIMAVLRTRVRLLVDAVLQSKDVPTMLAWESRRWNDPGILVRMMLIDIAFVALLDEDGDAIESLHRVFNASTTEVGLKADVELSAVAFDMAYHHLPEPTRAAYRTSAVTRARRRITELRGSLYKSAGHNMTLGAALPGIHTVLAIAGDPGVPNLDAEMTEMLLFLEAVLSTAIKVDGYPEEDTGYGTGVAAELSEYVEPLRRAGVYDPYKSCPRYTKFGQAILHFVQPWGENLANTGDHGADFQHREFILSRLAETTRDPSLLWLLGTLYYTHGMVHPANLLPEQYVEVPLRKGFRAPATAMSFLMLPVFAAAKHPAKLNVPTAYCDRGRGIVSFRSGWNDDATFVTFDGAQRSPAAAGHFHDSCGHFSISALGEFFAVDNGRYNNEQTCHNVVLVDGKPGRPLKGEWNCNYAFGRLTKYAPGKLVDTAAVDSSHQHDALWAWRHLGLVKGDDTPAYVWTVDDVNKDNDLGVFWWTLNTSPENVIELKGDSATIKGWRKGNLLDVHFALPAPTSYPKPYSLELSQDINTASAHAYLDDLEALARGYPKLTDQLHGALYIRPRLVAKVAGNNGRFMSIMIPRRAKEPAAKVERVESLDNSLAVRITFPRAGVVDTLIWAYDHSLLRADGVDARGRWCLARRAIKSGKLVASAIEDGTSFVVDGKRVGLGR